ncbi:2'-5' RNA ligase family protein [Kineosporia sp. J2-2]|uniref:2'-5' RNA ligase family protein n=1 Tax=Kineosporia corallincola TaxID=2835133 RepID=A0ABS5TFV4_9ACTN|nr:2'-5' RNA ligase family protein [Kineosporia corallincola]MBT0769962.1 2'-5' RNA ligase family protein [Kineosporia corallincola]
MQPFNFRPATGPWSTGEARLAVCIVPDLTRDRGLGVLVRDCREAMAPFPITTVPDELLRVTLAQVNDAPAGQIDDAGRKALLEGLREHLAPIPPVTVTAGSPLAYATGALCDLEVEPLAALGSAVRAAVAAVRGAEAGHPGIEHMTLGYAYAEASTDELARTLRRVRPSHARLTVDAVRLIEVTAGERAFAWTTVGEVSLP